jgi:hypothetical protein
LHGWTFRPDYAERLEDFDFIARRASEIRAATRRIAADLACTTEASYLAGDTRWL